MKLALIFLPFWTLSLIFWAPFAQSSETVKDCEPALIQDSEFESMQLAEKLIAYSVLKKENYERKKKNGSIVVPGYFVGDWKSFTEAMSTIFSDAGYLSSVEGRRNHSKFYLSKNSTDAYLGCLKTVAQGRLGLHAYFAKVSSQNVVVFIRWSPTEQPKGAKKPSIKVKVTVEGAIASTQEKEYTLLPNQDIPLIFKRKKSEEFILIASPSFGQASIITAPPSIDYEVVKKDGPTITKSYKAYCEFGGSECAGGEQWLRAINVQYRYLLQMVLCFPKTRYGLFVS